MPTILNVPAVRVAKISIYDENDKVVYKSVYEAAVVNNIKKQAISRCCKITLKLVNFVIDYKIIILFMSINNYILWLIFV